jgi:hypothetical protein
MKTEKTIAVSDIIIPSKAIYQNIQYELHDVPKEYVIFGYKIMTLDSIICSLRISSKHPNADKNGNFCLPLVLLTKKYTKEMKTSINSMLECFNLDNCYFTPYNVKLYRKETK